MTMDMVAWIISITLGLLNIVSYFSGKRRGAKDEGFQKGVLLTEIKIMKEHIAEIKEDVKLLNIESIKTELNNLKKQVYTNRDDIKKLMEH